MNAFSVSGLLAEQERTGKAYLEFLRVPALSAGVYVLPAGATDPQSPHREDEVYCVLRGRAWMRLGDTELPVANGTIIHVPAGVEHRFHSITEELAVLVLFAPAESPPEGVPRPNGTG
jgi:mannose-6-phosphate isomerase-like protein (cupin superfamily)